MPSYGAQQLLKEIHAVVHVKDLDLDLETIIGSLLSFLKQPLLKYKYIYTSNWLKHSIFI